MICGEKIRILRSVYGELRNAREKQIIAFYSKRSNILGIPMSVCRNCEELKDKMEGMISLDLHGQVITLNRVTHVKEVNELKEQIEKLKSCINCGKITCCHWMQVKEKACLEWRPEDD
jgi:pseudouridine-5'-phosphate glycosidase